MSEAAVPLVETWPARLYDGVSPRPRGASLAIEGGRCTLRLAGREDAVPLGHRDILRHEQVGREYQLDLDPRSIEAPSAKLVVGEAGFDESLRRFLLASEDRPLVRLRLRLRRVPPWAWLLAVLVAAPAAYAAITRLSLAAHRLISPEAEADLGEAVYSSLLDEFSPCEDAALLAELQAMVDELVEPDSPHRCRVSVFRSPEVNAFALPGGRIVVLSGLLEASESAEEVLGVLAHEVAHVEGRHALKHLLRAMGVAYFMGAAVGGGFEELELIETATEAAGFILVLRHSREAEAEADALAVAKLHRGRRSVDGLIRFFERVRKEEAAAGAEAVLRWLGTHPPTANRLEELVRARATEVFPARPWRRGGEDWRRLARTCAGDPPVPGGEGLERR